MSRNETVAFLRRNELLREISDEALATIASELEPRTVAAGTALFEEGSTGHAAYLIVDGWVALVAGGVELVRRGPGGIVGEFALIDDQPRSASGIARTRVELLVWERRAFQRSLTGDPVLGRNILHVLTRKLRDDVRQSVGLRVERDQWRHDLARARAMQAGMLPAEEVSLPGLEVAGHCAPVGTLGGDFYDVLPLDGGRVGLLIADVTGSGVYSGLFVAMTKTALHTQAAHDPSPAAMMTAMRHTLALSREWSIMMSCAYLLFDLHAGRLHWANAGHPYPLLRHARDGRITPLDALDVVLGVQEVDEVRYTSRTVAWEPGDLLVLYTDGVTEARAASDEMFGRARIETRLAALAGARAVDLRDTLLDAVHDHVAPGAQEDDVTLVAVAATAR